LPKLPIWLRSTIIAWGVLAAAAVSVHAGPELLYSRTVDEKIYDLHLRNGAETLLAAAETHLLAVDVGSGAEQKLRSSLLSQPSYDQAVLWQDFWLRLDSMEGWVSSIDRSDYLFKKGHLELASTDRFRWEPGTVYAGRCGFVHANDRGLLTAYDPELNITWQTQFPSRIERVQFSEAGSLVYAAGKTYLLHCDSGRMQAEITHSGQLEALPIVFDNQVYALLRNGSKWSLAAYDGQGDKHFSTPLPWGRRAGRGVVFAFDCCVLAAVPIAADRASVAALDRSSGELKWILEYDLHFLAAASVQTEDWVLLAGQSSLKAIHPDSGETRWQHTVYGGPEKVYVFSGSPQMAALISRSGELQLLRITDP